MNWNKEQALGEKALRKMESDDARDAARFRWLEKQATQKTTYDVFGNGGLWSIGVFSNDSRLSFAQAVDAAKAKGGGQ